MPHPERVPVPGSRWTTVTSFHDGKSERHEVPIEDLQHEATTDCACGPWVVHHPTVRLVQHYALDASFYYWGPEGPELERAPL